MELLKSHGDVYDYIQKEKSTLDKMLHGWNNKTIISKTKTDYIYYNIEMMIYIGHLICQLFKK